MNANEGIAIDVYGDQRLWIDTNGNLRAKRLIITEDDVEPVELPDGSYISKLTVSSVRTIEEGNPDDYIWVKDQYIRFMAQDGDVSDDIKMEISLSDSTGTWNGIPMIRMGIGNGNGIDEIGFIVKDTEAFKFNYYKNGQLRRLWFPANGDGAILESLGSGVKITSDQKVRLEVGDNYIEISTSGVKIVGSRIDLN